ncbi:hypothetical protein Q7P37_002747 [Cladosporium fusiforme]
MAKSKKKETLKRSRRTVDVLLSGAQLTLDIRSKLQKLVGDLSVSQARLKGEAVARQNQITNLNKALQGAHNELEKVRATNPKNGTQSDDDLVKLYRAGTQLITKQAAEIKAVKFDLQRAIGTIASLKESSARKLQDKDKQGAQLEKEKMALEVTVQDLEARVASMATDNVAKGNTEQQLKDARALVNTLHGMIDKRNKTVGNLRACESRLLAENADLSERLGVEEDACEELQAISDEQAEHIQQLLADNARLLAGMNGH